MWIGARTDAASENGPPRTFLPQGGHRAKSLQREMCLTARPLAFEVCYERALFQHAYCWPCWMLACWERKFAFEEMGLKTPLRSSPGDHLHPLPGETRSRAEVKGCAKYLMSPCDRQQGLTTA